MRIWAAVVALGMVAGPASAQAVNWSGATRVDITLSSFAFAPKTIHLRAGQPVVLHLVNGASGGHNFAARDFFAASSLRPEDRAIVRNGTVELDGNAVRDISLVPRAGHYRLRCTHTFHTAFGMSGEIIVD